MVGKQAEIRTGNPPNTSQLCVLQTAWYFHINYNKIIIFYFYYYCKLCNS